MRISDWSSDVCSSDLLGAEQLHAEHVGGLALDVGGAHVDDAGLVEERAEGGGGDAMLTGAGLGDDAGLAHAPRQQDLPQPVLGLVGAGVVRSEEGRVGHVCVSTCRSRWTPDHIKTTSTS